MLEQAVLQAVEAAKLAAGNLVIPATLTRRGQATHVPGSAPTYPETTFTVEVLQTKFEESEIDGQRVKASDFKFLAFPKTGVATPEPNDLLEISNVSYRVIYNDRVMAGKSVALSQLQLRLI